MRRPHEIDKKDYQMFTKRSSIGRLVVPNSRSSSSNRSVIKRTVAAWYEADRSLCWPQGSPSRVGHELTVVDMWGSGVYPGGSDASHPNRAEFRRFPIFGGLSCIYADTL